MNQIEILAELDKPPREVQYLETFILSILDVLAVDNWQMGLLITDDNGIREFNRRWRNIDKATDVLSFVQDDGEVIPAMPGMPKEAGDIIISLETVAENARQWDNSYDEELRRTIIHGILHLDGMDHPGDDYKTGMLKLQEELLADTGSIIKDNN